MSFLHIVATRFNLGCTDAAWMEHRVRLFERFTLASLRAQTSSDFHWLLLCDEATPDVWKDRLRGYESERTRVVWTRKRSGTWHRSIRELCTAGKTHVVTTRVDNDDAVCRDFIERIHAAVSPGAGREFLNFPLGYLWFRGRVTRMVHRSNSFISCCEPIRDFRTVYCEQHVHLSRIAPVRQIDRDSPRWVRICHDWNWHNKPPRGKGIRWQPEDVLSAAFALNLEAPLPSPANE